ncbi:MAG: ABC transporter ATP-binding protein [Clostridiales Family XIII bacterium]|jgi:ABC-2 type transport system ATP-binding protein|nr:ABC transporter ATP-binding protein [Clostridiales Family XIII bacterium]
MTAILEAKGLSKHYAQVAALNEASFALEAGRIVGLLGPNGSGKTTLIKLACDLLAPTAGEILVDGMAPGVETKKIVSYLPDRVYFDERMKVGDCVEMFADFYEDFDVMKANEMLAQLGVAQQLLFKNLSKGTKEKAQLCFVMSRKAKLYLLDEPIGGVDPAARDYILSTILRNYNEDGTVLISTHLIYDIERILDDVLFLNWGRVVRHQSTDELREQTGKSVDEVFREVFKC